MSTFVSHTSSIRREPIITRNYAAAIRPQYGVVFDSFHRSLSFNGVRFRLCEVRASMVDSSSENSSDFAKRIEQAWLISQQPTPVGCDSCNSEGNVECKWCGGTGFFILGNNMLCEVPSKNSACLICSGQGSMRCADCHGTGFRAKWLGKPPIYNK